MTSLPTLPFSDEAHRVNRHSLASPPEVLNPLAYVSDFSPLLFKIKRIFGAVRPVLPPGSALPPGSSVPPPTPQPHNALAGPAPPTPHPSSTPSRPIRNLPRQNQVASPALAGPGPFASLAPAASEWETLSRQAIAAYTAAGHTSPQPFIDVTSELLAHALDLGGVAASGSGTPGRGAVVVVDSDEDYEEENQEEEDGDVEMDVKPAERSGTAGGRGRKRKRKPRIGR